MKNNHESNPAFPIKREKLMLTSLITHYDDIKNNNVEQMIESIEVNKFDPLEKEVNQNIFQQMVYYLNLSNPRELLLLTLFSVITTVILIILDNIIFFGVNFRYSLLSNNNSIDKVIYYFISSQILSLIATSVGYFISPDSDGSGIPEIKVVLSGNPMYHFYNMNAFIGKTIGLIAGLSGGMTIGRSGNYIHISGIIGRQILKLSWFNDIRSSVTGKNMMLVFSCSAGFTLAFGTPLAAVIFTIEQTSTVFLVSNLWKSFYVAMNCIFIKNVIYNATRIKFNNIEEEYIDKLIDVKNEAIFFIILGLLSGIIGSCFNIIMGKLAYIRRNTKNSFISNRWKYVSIVSFVTCLVALILPPLRSDQSKLFNVLWRPNNAVLKSFNSSDKSTKEDNLEVNNINNEDIYYSLVDNFNSKNKTDDSYAEYTNSIKSELDYYENNTLTNIINHQMINNKSDNNNSNQVNKGYYPLLTLLHPNEFLLLTFCFIFKFILSILCSTANLPLGIIGPVFLLGSFFGRLYGHVLNILFGIKDEYLYSMAGAACFLSGSIHSITPPILIFELTGQIDYLIHLLFASLLANLIGKSLSVSGFDIILFIRKLPYLPSIKSSRLYELTAKDIREKTNYYLRIENNYNDKQSSSVEQNITNNPMINNNKLEFYSNNTSFKNQNETNIINNLAKSRIQSFNYQNNYNIIVNNNHTLPNDDSNNYFNETLEEEFVRHSLHLHSSEDNKNKIFNEFNLISGLILLYKLPKKYFINIPVVDYNNHIVFTITADRLFLYILNEFNLNKNKFDVRIHSSMNQLLSFLQNKIITDKGFSLDSIYNKFRSFFDNLNDRHKHRLDTYFLDSSMFEIIRRLKDFSSINKNSLLNNKICFKSNILQCDYSFLTIDEGFSALRIHFLFTFLSMSHLFVTNKGKLVGIITKDEFIRKSMAIND